MICNIKAGGVGIDLFDSSHVGFIEFPWHPADCEQCEDRLHRNGQKNAVRASYFLGEETIDGWLWDKILEKRDVSDMITGAENKVDEVIDSLINYFNKRKHKTPSLL
jgi:SWI/SNF-related matrix-associated actin-dependent regulator 1 of chromatin subfamily A